MSPTASVSPEPQAERLWKTFFTVGEVPREAIREALDDWNELSPFFLARLEAYVRDPKSCAEDTDALLIPVHLFAQMRDVRAYRPLIALVSLPNKQAEAVMGDAITETLSRIAASVFDGDPTPMQQAVLDPHVDEFVACALFDALTFLTADGRIAHGVTRLFVEHCHRQFPRDNSEETCGMRWVGWQRAISYLGYTEYVPLVREAFLDDWIPSELLELEHFEKDLAQSLEAHSRGEVPRDLDMGYFEDAIEEFSKWYTFTEKYLHDRERWEREKRARERRELWGRVSRNDPCPCGSGKKYKKCCLDK